MKMKWQIVLGSIFLIAACSQDGAWQSACGCAFNLSEYDRGRARIVALSGDKPAMQALIDHYSATLEDDEEALWKARLADPENFVSAVKAAEKRATSLKLPALDSDEVAQRRRSVEKGDLKAIRWLTTYLIDIGLDDEATLWRTRSASLDASDKQVRTIAANITQAEKTDDWTINAPLIETAYKDIIGFGRSNEWLPEDNLITLPFQKRLSALVHARHKIDKKSISYTMCMRSDLEEKVGEMAGSDVVSCEYAKGKYPVGQVKPAA